MIAVEGAGSRSADDDASVSALPARAAPWGRSGGTTVSPRGVTRPHTAGWAMTEVGTGPVVVGIDGSAVAKHATAWAAREAARHGTRLRIVYADVTAVPLLSELPWLREPKAHSVAVRTEVQRWLTVAIDIATDIAPDVAIETDSRAGGPATVLIEESKEAQLLVVGDRGFGGFTGLLAGSTAVALAAHGHCPTAVVRGADIADESKIEGTPVVAGVDGTRASAPVLAFAFDSAAWRGVPLHAVHTWHTFGVDARWLPTGRDSDEHRANEERVLSEALAGWSEQYPDVEVQRFVETGSPTVELLDRAKTAQLVVVGSRGRGGFRGMLLGSTSQALIHHAACPVVVMRTGR